MENSNKSRALPYKEDRKNARVKREGEVLQFIDGRGNVICTYDPEKEHGSRPLNKLKAAYEGGGITKPTYLRFERMVANANYASTSSLVLDRAIDKLLAKLEADSF